MAQFGTPRKTELQVRGTSLLQWQDPHFTNCPERKLMSDILPIKKKTTKVQRMKRKAYYSGRAQADHVPVISLHVQGHRDYAQLIRKTPDLAKLALL